MTSSLIIAGFFLNSPATSFSTAACIENAKTIDLMACVVMLDHVHLLFQALRNEKGWPYSLPHIIRNIKSASAHKINRELGHIGPGVAGKIWQEEFFDHVPCEPPNHSPAQSITSDSIRLKPAWLASPKITNGSM